MPVRPLLHKKELYYHIAGWTIFILYEVTLVKIVRSASGFHDPVLTAYVIPYVINICLFYFHSLFVIQFCFGNRKRKLALFALLVITELAVYLVMIGLVKSKFFLPDSNFFALLYSTEVDFVKQLWRGIYFLIFATAFWIIRRNFLNIQLLREAEKNAIIKEKENQELELKLISTENAFLQAQINPHLLFNTLNFIHSEIQDAAPDASDAIITLSEMMRYSFLGKTGDGKVELQKEIEQVENLIRINQHRFRNKLLIQLNIVGDLEKTRIIPLLLIPFVENLFKYADLNDENAIATISIEVQKNRLQFSTFNKKRKLPPFPSNGIGIKNVCTRLNSYYPSNFSLQIQDDDCSYLVNLKIKLDD